VFALKREISMLLLVLASALAFLPLCKAQIIQANPGVTVYGYTDKPYYWPGGTGTLRFWVYNTGNTTLALESVTINYPWYNGVGLWGGNVTIAPPKSTIILPGGSWSGTSSFTVPNDGRISSAGSNIIVAVATNETNVASYITMNIASKPSYFSLQNMNQLLTWLIILVVAIVICTLIIVGAMFISACRLRGRPLSTESPS
jgi:hypothetical protein